MIIPDANLLIFAHDRTCPQHDKARTWWEAALSSDETIGIPWVVLLAFTRIMTHPQICAAPLDGESVREMVQQWLDCPQVRVIQVSERAVGVFFDLLAEAEMGGNLSTDALIAVHAREHSAVIYSNDRDFDRFPGIRWKNPLR
ncbi:VapC toxin family PIN domain ribonuclease [Coraliomargarita sinensis]|uniref:Ribonuclease VapC n=1 Tax=Coraliomargarita sinensis TaxID=2174842 RepID=A0A317ZGN2_9BACT|nr:TA system VapC family ribonuclease toxin [Coraliomargarita sinensis]PXA03517.1 VapC toxin family PIN domain ribonuclease [Coraliomargarita sinensis]